MTSTDTVRSFHFNRYACSASYTRPLGGANRQRSKPSCRRREVCDGNGVSRIRRGSSPVAILLKRAKRFRLSEVHEENQNTDALKFTYSARIGEQTAQINAERTK